MTTSATDPDATTEERPTYTFLIFVPYGDAPNGWYEVGRVEATDALDARRVARGTIPDAEQEPTIVAVNEWAWKPTTARLVTEPEWIEER